MFIAGYNHAQQTVLQCLRLFEPIFVLHLKHVLKLFEKDLHILL